MAHRIRLGPPWAVTREEGRTRHARKFGRPRTLDADEQVWLVCGSLPAGSKVTVNGTSVVPDAANITSLLLPRNEVVIVSPAPDSLGEIALEIRFAPEQESFTSGQNSHELDS